MRKKTPRSPAVGADEVAGNTHLCCHPQRLQTAMCELRTSLPTLGSLVCRTSTGGKGCTLPSLYPWILSLRVCSIIILVITSTFVVCERLEGLDDEARRVHARDEDDDALDWRCVFSVCIAPWSDRQAAWNRKGLIQRHCLLNLLLVQQFRNSRRTVVEGSHPRPRGPMAHGIHCLQVHVQLCSSSWALRPCFIDHLWFFFFSGVA